MNKRKLKQELMEPPSITSKPIGALSDGVPEGPKTLGPNWAKWKK